MISLETLFKEPRCLLEFYKTAFNDPKGFVKNLKLDEHLKYTVYTTLIFFLLTSFTKILHIGLIQLSLAIFIVMVSVLFGGALTFGIAYCAKAKISFQECVTLQSYISILSFPFGIFSSVSDFLRLCPMAVYFLLTYLVIVNERDGDKNIVTWILGILGLLTVVALAI